MRLRVLLLTLLLPLTAQAKKAPREASSARAALEKARDATGAGHYGLASWHSEFLAHDLLGDPGDAHVGLSLPPREQECLNKKVKCWLVFFLLGFDATAEGFGGAPPAPPTAIAGKELEAWTHRHAHDTLANVLEQLNARPDAAPLVVVVVDGRTRLGGGWFVDSPASGKWESFVMDELLPAAREALAPGTPAERTLVMGHSMGGFGALHLAMAHPRAFHAAAGFNPAAHLVALGDEVLARLDAAGTAPDAAALVSSGGAGHFRERVLLSMGGAFFPDPKAPNGLQPLFDPAQHPWKLSDSARAALAKDDVALHAKDLIPLARAQIYAGRADALVPLPDLQAIADAANGEQTQPAASVGLDGGGTSAPAKKQVELIATDGDHLSHLGADLKQALETLAR